MRVVEWIPYSVAEGKPEAPIGGLGGWFDKGHRWSDYIAIWQNEGQPYAEAIRESVIERGHFIGGDNHQNDPDGVPLFEDGTVALFSYRGWGDLMGAIATEVDDQDRTYMDFYMGGLSPMPPSTSVGEDGRSHDGNG